MQVLAQSDPTTWRTAFLIMAGVGLLLVFTGRFVISIAQRAANGILGSNPLAGVRTRATTASPEAWRAAHGAARGATVAGGWVMVAAGPVSALLAVLFTGENPDQAIAIWGIIVMAFGMISTVLIVLGALRGHRAATEHNARTGTQI